MGREVRMVPANWVHPRDERGRYKPAFDGSYEEAAQRWHDGYAKFQPTEYSKHYWEYDSPPDEERYMFAEPVALELRTHFQMYENTSEGTPISPVFDNVEDLARWLADTGASSFGSMTATYEEWLALCKRGWAMSAVIQNGEIVSGVEALAKMEAPNV